MSTRSIRRAHARKLAAEQRRAWRRRRAGIVSVAAAGATTILVSTAQGATIPVTTNADTGAGSLRSAVTQANMAGGANTITFSGVTGLIRLVNGELPISGTDALTIIGPGAGTLTISGDKDSSGGPTAGDSRIFDITSSGAVSITGLTLTHGDDTSAGLGGGAIYNAMSPALTLTDDVISDSSSVGGSGGGIESSVPSGTLTLTRTTVSGNSAAAGDGGGVRTTPSQEDGSFTITGGSFSGNTAREGGGLLADDRGTIDGTAFTANHAALYPSGTGGGAISNEDTLSIKNSVISGNTSDGIGGGISNEPFYKYDGSLSVANSTISGNTASFGGGIFAGIDTSKYSSVAIEQSTISGNQATHGAGIDLYGVGEGSRFTIDRSTISGNAGGAGSFGGGLLIDGAIYGAAEVLDSTISGNTATAGAGVSIGSDDHHFIEGPISGKVPGSIDFDNSTIASNAAAAHGGGVYLAAYTNSASVMTSGTATLTSTIVGANTAAGASQDLDRANTSTGGGFGGGFSLIQTPGDAPLAQVSGITGVDPQLGALAGNGGPTATQLPSGTSPVIDKGRSPLTLTVEQRGTARVVNTAIADAPAGGDGTDIGAVELPASAVVLPPPPPPPPVVPPAPSPFSASIGGSPAKNGQLIFPGLSPVTCVATSPLLTTCTVNIVALSKTTTRATTSVGKGAVLATGTATSPSGVSSLSTSLVLTVSGEAVLKTRPLGLDATATVIENGTATSLPVHLLANRSITLPLGTRSAKLSSALNKQLGQAAKLLTGAKSVTCSAYSDTGKNDATVTKAQAKAVCARLVKAGVKAAKVTATGKGHAKPIASNKSSKGRVANRRVIITFTF